MTTNQLWTGAAAAFAVYALWYVHRTPGKAVATQPAQQQRDNGLTNFLHVWTSTESDVLAGRTNGQQVMDYTGVNTAQAQDSSTTASLYGAAGYG